MKLAIRAGGLILLSCLTSFAQNSVTPTDDAVRESIRREAAKIELRQRLTQAQEAQRRGEFNAAAKLYEDCVTLIRHVGTGIELEQQEVLRGIVVTRLALAEQAQRRGDFTEADNHVERILKLDPRNEQALAFKRQLEEEKLRSAGMRPSQETITRLPELRTDRVTAATLVQDGKLLYEAGKLDEAEQKLIQAAKMDPNSRAPFHYLELIKEQRYKNHSAAQQQITKGMLLDISKAWNEPITRDALPSPNPMARTNLVKTSKGRQAIYSKLDRIRLDLQADNLPLGAVVNLLSDEARKRDPEKIGINIFLNSNLDPAAPPTPVIDPATGLPIPGTAPEPVDLSAVQVRIMPPLLDITLGQALDAISKATDRPIKFSVEDYAIIVSPRPPETPTLYTRFFRVDPNTFIQGMQGVVVQSFGEAQQGGGGGGGGRGGGGGGGRGGGGSRGGGGQGQGQGQGQGGSEYVSVRLAPGGFGQQGGGQAFQQQPQLQAGQQRLPGSGQGVDNLTVITPQDQYNTLVRTYFQAAGVDLAPPKQVFFNDRLGNLMVRATLQDLDIIEQAVQVLNQSPPQLTIEARFAEVSQDDTRALGFDWLLGNTLLFGDRAGVQGGTAPSYGSPGTSGSQANPSGIFPGPAAIDPVTGLPVLTPGFVNPAATDNLLTAGLRNAAAAPAVATLTGILTDPQFRLVIRALEQRQGVDVLVAPKITTLSSRQAQIKTVEVRYIVTDLDVDQTAAGGGTTAVTGTTTTGGGVGSLIVPLAEPFELGPVLDVVPYVSADGYTIQMTIIPTIKEFVGYDLESAQIFQAQAQSVGQAASAPLTQVTPLPIFRLRQVVTSAIVWDGQTVVLGGLISENVTKTKDKVPVLGDLPVAGRLFRSESSSTRKKNLLIFVTPTIIDPAGNRVHTDEELPFAQTSIPPQRPLTQ
jgi:type II secretory pathway component GspD/PulD (secretin)/tetratricopeptide (TPR) repeat protein